MGGSGLRLHTAPGSLKMQNFRPFSALAWTLLSENAALPATFPDGPGDDKR